MPRFPRPLAAALLLLAAAPPALAAPPGFAFLEIPAGARISGLAGAGATFALGAEGMFWNPAALAGTRGTEITGSHYELYQSLRHEDFAISGRLLGGGLAGSVQALYSGTIDERDDLGNVIGGFGYHALDFALGWGASFGGGVTAGASAHLIRERLADKAAQTWAFDLGTGWSPAALPALRLGLAAKHLGPSAAYSFDGVEGEPVALPAAVQAGGSWAFPVGTGLDLRAGLEGRFTRGRSGVGMVAGELTGIAGAAVRAGLRVNDDVANVSLGMGWTAKSLAFDYAWVPSRLDLEDTHRVSFGARF